MRESGKVTVAVIEGRRSLGSSVKIGLGFFFSKDNIFLGFGV